MGFGGFVFWLMDFSYIDYADLLWNFGRGGFGKHYCF